MNHAIEFIETPIFNKQIKILATDDERSEEHTSELQSLEVISYAVFCLKKNFF